MTRGSPSLDHDIYRGAVEEGRIPLAFRIGVTGHRRIEDEPALAAAVRDALGRIRRLAPVSPETPLVLVVVSALAQGADRLVTREILEEPGSRLEASLPLAPEDYLHDFDSEASKREFRDLLALSSEIWRAPPSRTRDEAYERAGRRVVDRSDALIAVWDGERSEGRGGTAEIVAYARAQGVPLVWVKTTAGPSVIEQLDTPRAEVTAEAARELDLYNRSRIPPDRIRVQAESRLKAWGVPLRAEATEPGPLPLERVARWLLPYFVRADLLALRFQRRSKVMSASVFLLASAAVAVVATQTKLFPETPWIVAFEVISLLGVLAILGLSRRSRSHERWISHRFMAERLRSLYFLVLSGGVGSRESSRLAFFTDPSEAWIERALTELTWERPRGATDPPVEALREYLCDHWILSQATYHEDAAGEQRARDAHLIRATAVLFGITLVASLLHLLGIGGHGDHESRIGALVVVVAIVVPVVGAALHGIGTQRQFRRHSERYGRMAELLKQLHTQMRQAATLEDVRTIAVETERVMREENSDWFGVMRFHDIELIT